MEGSDGAVFASLYVVAYSFGPILLMASALTGGRNRYLGVQGRFPGPSRVVSWPVVVALRVRLGVASQLLVLEGALSLVVCGWSTGLVQVAVRVVFGVLLNFRISSKV
jgi:hypothetical protein